MTLIFSLSGDDLAEQAVPIGPPFVHVDGRRRCESGARLRTVRQDILPDFLDCGQQDADDLPPKRARLQNYRISPMEMVGHWGTLLIIEILPSYLCQGKQVWRLEEWFSGNAKAGKSTMKLLSAREAKHAEGRVARMTEGQTVKIPSDVFPRAAVAPVGAAFVLAMTDRHEKSQFVGAWAAPFLLFGLYNKLVKVVWSERRSFLPLRRWTAGIIGNRRSSERAGSNCLSFQWKESRPFNGDGGENMTLFNRKKETKRMERKASLIIEEPPSAFPADVPIYTAAAVLGAAVVFEILGSHEKSRFAASLASLILLFGFYGGLAKGIFGRE
jgi:hypothetical protein